MCAPEYGPAEPSPPLIGVRLVMGQDCEVEMEVCVWRESGYDHSFVVDPTSAQVAQALGSLNGAERNDLYLRAASGPWMGFGGGPNQVIATYSETLEGPHYQAVVPGSDDPDKRVTLMVGGQEVEFPGRHLIALENAITAAVSFAETGERPDALAWEPSG